MWHRPRKYLVLENCSDSTGLRIVNSWAQVPLHNGRWLCGSPKGVYVALSTMVLSVMAKSSYGRKISNET